MSKTRLLIILFACLIVGVALLAGPFFWSHLRYTLNPPKIINETERTVTVYEPNTLIIESLGITAPIVYVADNTDAAFKQALARGVVHYPGTANLGSPGNVYIFGHSSDLPWSKGAYKTIFALLPRINLGAKIIATDSQGNAFTYTVTESFSTSAHDVKLLENTSEEYRLTLQTSYPIGTTLKRWIVIGELQ